MKIYTYKGLPTDWIVKKDGECWIVPAHANGWSDRRPFKGHRSALKEVPGWNSIGLGIPR